MFGLISAMEEELVLFKKNCCIEEIVTQAGIDFHIGKLANQKVILLRCGVGKVNAAIATQLLIDRFGVDAVIFTGIAGSLVPYVNGGDVVVSNFVVQHDIDLTAFGRRPGEIPELTRQIESDPKLVAAATAAYDLINETESLSNQMIVGTIATGDSFVSDPQKIKWLQREFGAIATEMEGGAVGQVCQMNKVPFVVIRVISDSAGEGAAGEFIFFLEKASQLTFKIASGLLEQLSAKVNTGPD